jgi:hypothetical protein
MVVNFVGLQRDTKFSNAWTNGEGYCDRTAGAALNNIMRERKNTENQLAPRQKKGDTTEYISVVHPKPKKESKKQPNQTIDAEAQLKCARTVFTICQQVAQLQKMAIVDIVLRDKATNQTWRMGELTAPPPKKKE